MNKTFDSKTPNARHQQVKKLTMMEEGRRRGAPPHGLLLAVVVAAVVLVPFMVGDGGEAITSAVADMLSPVGLLLLPILLLLAIHFLSSDRGSVVASILSTGEPESIHRVSGSPVGVALFLVLIMVLLYNRVSIFGGQDDSAE